MQVTAGMDSRFAWQDWAETLPFCSSQVPGMLAFVGTCLLQLLDCAHLVILLGTWMVLDAVVVFHLLYCNMQHMLELMRNCHLSNCAAHFLAFVGTWLVLAVVAMCHQLHSHQMHSSASCPAATTDSQLL